MNYEALVEAYIAGPDILKRSVSGMSDYELAASPVQFKWSTRQVVFHLSDFDLMYANQMKLVIAENEPALIGGDGKLFADRLGYEKRNVDDEIQLIVAVRQHMGSILRSINPRDFVRRGIHSINGPMMLADLLQRVTDHIPHHAQYIEEKRKALKLSERAIPFDSATIGGS
jgi:hypothetical protein